MRGLPDVDLRLSDLQLIFSVSDILSQTLIAIRNTVIISHEK